MNFCRCYRLYASDAAYTNHSAPDREAEYCDERVCVFVCPRSYLRNYTSDLHLFLCMLPMAVAGSSSGGVVIGYALPVLWMTSCLLICQGCLDVAAQRTRSLGLGYKECAVIPVAGQRTQGTAFRALKVTSQVATPAWASAHRGKWGQLTPWKNG